MGGWTGRWTDKRRNLPTDQVNEVSQYLEPSRGAEGTKKEENSLQRAGCLGIFL